MVGFGGVFPIPVKPLGVPVPVTIGSAGVLILTGSGTFIVNAYSSTSDDLVQVTGLQVGDEVTLLPASGDTITVVDGANMSLGNDRYFVMNGTKDNITLKCVSAGVCYELTGRVSNDV